MGGQTGGLYMENDKGERTLVHQTKPRPSKQEQAAADAAGGKGKTRKPKDAPSDAADANNTGEQQS